MGISFAKAAKTLALRVTMGLSSVSLIARASIRARSIETVPWISKKADLILSTLAVGVVEKVLSACADVFLTCLIGTAVTADIADLPFPISSPPLTDRAW
jgi:hypothetical protein